MGSDQPQPSLQVTDRFVRKMLAEEESEKERKRGGRKGRGRGEHSRKQAGRSGGAAVDEASGSSGLLQIPPATPLPHALNPLNPLFFGGAVAVPPASATALDAAVAASGVEFAAEAEAAFRAQRRKEELAEIEKTLEQVKSLRDNIARQRQEEAVRATQMAQALQAQQFRPPSREVPCQAEREECLRCYTQNAKDPLSCASVVNKFVECSRRAQQAFMASEGRQ